MTNKILLAVTLALAASLLPNTLLGWGRTGHHLIAHLAEKEMEPAVLAAVQEILGDETMADVSMFADQIRRSRPETAPFHYVNGPRGVLVPREEDFHLAEGNVYTAVLGYAELVAETELSPNARREALMFLIHFIGDIHQPMHTAFSDDLGGNSYRVIFGERTLNIHRIWDNEILGPYMGMDTTAGAQSIFSQFSDADRQAWASAGDPRQWVVEARARLFAGMYPVRRMDIPGHEETGIGVVDETYMDIWHPVAVRQIARAGTRLAATLNAIFTTGTSPFQPLPVDLPLLRDLEMAEVLEELAE